MFDKNINIVEKTYFLRTVSRFPWKQNPTLPFKSFYSSLYESDALGSKRTECKTPIHSHIVESCAFAIRAVTFNFRGETTRCHRKTSEKMNGKSRLYQAPQATHVFNRWNAVKCFWIYGEWSFHFHRRSDVFMPRIQILGFWLKSERRFAERIGDDYWRK